MGAKIRDEGKGKGTRDEGGKGIGNRGKEKGRGTRDEGERE
jgi:hypothetical protein